MAARNTPKLADLLRKFEEAQQKTAGEPVPTSGDAVPQAALVTEPASTAPTAEKVAAAEQTREAENQTKEAENQAGDAAGQVVDAKEALKAVTDEFVNEHTAALKKEAQIFGELFAASCMEQMNKVAALRQVEQNAYATTVDALSAVNEAELMNKTAAIYDEAYFTTLAKFAGLESPEELQSILAGSPESLPPEVLNAALAASGDAPEAGGDVVTGPEAGNAEAGEALAEDAPDDLKLPVKTPWSMPLLKRQVPRVPMPRPSNPSLKPRTLWPPRATTTKVTTMVKALTCPTPVSSMQPPPLDCLPKPPSPTAISMRQEMSICPRSPARLMTT